MNALGPILTSDPVDFGHFLNQRKVAWFLSLPHLSGGRLWYDLLRRHTGTFGTDGLNVPAWGATTRPGGAFDLRFDSVNYVTPASLSARFGGPEATLTCWIKTDLATPVDEPKTGLFDLDTGGSSQNSHYPWTDGTVYLCTFRTARVSFANSGFDKSKWHHLAITTTPGAGGYIVYQDGEVAYSTTGQATAVVGATARIGISTGGYGFFGRLDGLALWDYALPQSSIRLDRELGRLGYPGMIRRIAPRPFAALDAGGGGGAFQPAWAVGSTQLAGVGVF